MTANTQAGPGARYFHDPGNGAIEQVFNLTDATPYLDLGYVEVTETEYVAATQAAAIDPAMPPPEPVKGTD